MKQIIENLKITKILDIIEEDIKNRYDLKNITVKFKNTLCGYAHYKTRKITIPIWAIQEGKYFATYYLIHELCHFILHDKKGFNGGHTRRFKNKEIEILKYYGLIPIYNRVYVKELRDLNNNILYVEEK